jgi:hypothetical protein
VADVQISSPPVTAAPANYTLPGAAEFILKAVNADFDGSGAGAAFLPAVVILSPSGQVIARAVDQNVSVAAGASAEVSWFPGVKNAAAAAAAGGAPDYIMLTGVAHAIPSVPLGASGQVPWSAASLVSNNAALWTTTLDGGGNIVQVNTTQPGRYESFAAFHFDAPAAGVDETFSITVVAGGVTNPSTSAAIRTTTPFEGLVGVFDQRSGGTMIFETDFNFDVATTGLVRGEWWWIKRFAL